MVICSVETEIYPNSMAVITLSLYFLTYPSPVQGAREVIAGAQRHDGNRRGRFNAQAVDFGQDPANSSITPTGQDSQVRHFLVQLKSKRDKINKLIRHF